MNLIIVAGATVNNLEKGLSGNKTLKVVGKFHTFEEAVNSLTDKVLDFDCMLGLDAGFTETRPFIDQLKDLQDLMEFVYPGKEIKLFFKDEILFKQAMGDKTYQNLFIAFNSKYNMKAILEFVLATEDKDFTQEQETETEEEKPTEKKSRIPKLNIVPSLSKVTDKTEGSSNNSAFEGIALNNKELNRAVIAVTGDRQSGISSTAANLAQLIADNGMTAIIVDLDVKRRGQNVYFQKFGEEAEVNEDIRDSLCGALLTPNVVGNFVSNINSNLGLISLGYAFGSEPGKFSNRLVNALTPQNVVSLLSILKVHYDFVIIDLPFESMKFVREAIGVADKVLFCVPNSIHCIVSSLQFMFEDYYKEDDNVLNLIIAKMYITLTKYNSLSKYGGKVLDTDLTARLINNFEFTESWEPKMAGIIPLTYEFEEQVSKGKRIVQYDNRYKKAYAALLSNLY